MTHCNSIYIHIPFCLSKCKYCDFFSVACEKSNDSIIPDSYIQALLKELDFYSSYLNLKSVKTIYIGGGTPSILTLSQLERLLHHIQEKLAFEKDYEFTIEVNPDDVTKEFICFLQDSVINRISCGIQSLSQKALDFCGRRAGVEENLNALSLFEKYWHKKLSLDLISALPEENEKDFLENLLFIINKKPHHISMYSLTIEEETKLGQELEKGLFEYDYDKADKMWLLGKELLKEKGYVQYEVSNFCRDNNQCKHNLVYWNHENYIGIGAGAAGSLYKKDGSGLRIANKNNISEYINFWNNFNNQKSSDFPFEQVSDKELVDRPTSQFEFFMMGLRKTCGITENQYFSVFGEIIPASVKKQFEQWEKQGKASCIIKDDDVIYKLTSRGLLFLNQFLQELSF